MKKTNEREKLLYIELPILIRRIVLEASIPLPTDKDYVLKEIEEVKKITNAECKSTLDYFKKYNYAFKE